jgi:hypothetical protein
LTWKHPGRLDRPLQAVRPPLPENSPPVKPQLPRARSPESLHGLQQNFGNSWVTSWATSTSKESTRNAHNQEESKKSLLLVKNSPNSKNHQIESDSKEIWGQSHQPKRHKNLIRDTHQKPQEIILKTPPKELRKSTQKRRENHHDEQRQTFCTCHERFVQGLACHPNIHPSL